MSFDLIDLSDKKADAAPQAAAFPGFISRTQSAWGRFARKAGVFIRLSGAGLAILAAAGLLLALILRGGAPGPAAIISAAVVILAGLLSLLALQAAMTAAAAFKIDGLKALGVGFSSLASWSFTWFLEALVTGLAGLALLVPGLVLHIRFSLALPVLLAEQRSGSEALARSRNLVWNRTAALGLQLLLIVSAKLTAVAAVFGLTWAAMSFLPAAPQLPLLSGAVSRWTLLLTPALIADLLLFPLPLIYLQLFYEDALAAAKGFEPAGAVSAQRYRRLAVGAAVVAVLTVAAAIIIPFFLTKERLGLPASLTTAGTPLPTAPPPPAMTDEDRDWERYRAMNVLRIALNSYVFAKQAYPEDLRQLIPTYLEKMPLDPSTGKPYEYVRTAAAYKISFDLEKGVLLLVAGRHQMTPKGMDIPEEAASQPQAPQAPEPEAVIPAPDADNDGLSDAAEQTLGTDLNKADSDGDGLTDREEVEIFRTGPLLADSDGDGFNDGGEVFSAFDPLSKTGKLKDADGDGLADIYEISRSLNQNDPDMDKDGLADGDELRIFGTDPRLTDTDHDGNSDLEELRGGFEPLGSGRIEDYRRAEIELKTAKYLLHPPTPLDIKP